MCTSGSSHSGKNSSDILVQETEVALTPLTRTDCLGLLKRPSVAHEASQETKTKRNIA